MNLTLELWTSLQAEPARRWLFTTQSGMPYTAKNFSKWCCSVLQKLFGRPLTLTLVRHSYLNSMDWNKLTIAARESLAADMCQAQKLKTPTDGFQESTVLYGSKGMERLSVN